MTALRIVIADDEAIIRMDLAEILTHAGYEVIGQASDGQAALDVIMDKLPDLAILDVKMPNLDGTEVAQALRDHTPIVLLTAFAQRDVIDQATAAGVLGYVVKPFNEAEIVAAIEVAHARFNEMAAVRTDRDALAEALETRKILDRAKALLQSQLNLSENDAFRWIQKAAMDRRLSIKDVASSVISELGK